MPTSPHPVPLESGDRKLTTGDFEDRFSVDKNGRLKYNGAVVETALGLKGREFKLAVTVAVLAGLNMIASWINATKRPAAPPAPAPIQVSCPAPNINFTPAPSQPGTQKLSVKK